MQVQNEEGGKKTDLNEVTNWMFIKMLYLEQQNSSHLVFKPKLYKERLHQHMQKYNWYWWYVQNIKSHIHLF